MSEFDAFLDHQAGFECDPYDVCEWHAEQSAAYNFGIGE